MIRKLISKNIFDILYNKFNIFTRVNSIISAKQFQDYSAYYGEPNYYAWVDTSFQLSNEECTYPPTLNRKFLGDTTYFKM